MNNAAEGQRRQRLEKEREKKQEELAAARKAEEDRTAGSGLRSFDSQAARVAEAADRDHREATIGLATRDEFLKARDRAARAAENEELRRLEDANNAEVAATARKKREREMRVKKSMLSFADDEDDSDDSEDEQEEKKKQKATEEIAVIVNEAAEDGADLGPAAKRARLLAAAAAAAAARPKFGKNPNVDTAFLPDRDRESAADALKAQLTAEWEAQEDILKAEVLSVVYSFWDGRGHRRTIQVKRGNTIAEFLNLARLQLASEFREMKRVGSADMLYIKEDLIMPHGVTFHELIATKARGKSGPLFHFDVHDDIRLRADATKEKDESHAGKVVERHWYERNKEYHPASRWETFDKNKDYGSYRIFDAKDAAKLNKFHNG